MAPLGVTRQLAVIPTGATNAVRSGTEESKENIILFILSNFLATKLIGFSGLKKKEPIPSGKVVFHHSMGIVVNASSNTDELIVP